ncbi:MAG TPA: protein phosphatase 2C domain-containing protein [Pirellulales bacterium]|nr:protein phosphatase 2C domain-containing protein [Pirellulales bacterium]
MASAVTWNDCLEYVALTDVGMRRANNQDAHAEVLAPDPESWFRRGHMFVVCDGMGAHAAGELASEMAAEGIPHNYLKYCALPAADAIRKSVEEVNGQIYSRGQANPDFQGMGTTASALLLLPQGALVAHVGDSRVYRLRGQRLEQLTFDHSLVWEMSAAGQVPKSALPGFVPKNIITRSLGPHAEVRVDLEGPYPLEPSDMFLLCSDGLSGQVQDAEIGALLQSLPPAEAAQVLVDLANLRGGPDNVTVIVVRVINAALTSAGGWQAEPLALTAQPPAAPPPPLGGKSLWIAAAVCLTVALVLGIAQWTIPALCAILVAIALGMISFLQRLTPTQQAMRYLPAGVRLGNGPHATIECQPNEELVRELISMIEQLREAATEEQWSVDWEPFNARSLEGKQALDARDFPRAVREYATALRFLMNELRQQQARVQTGNYQPQPRAENG